MFYIIFLILLEFYCTVNGQIYNRSSRIPRAVNSKNLKHLPRDCGLSRYDLKKQEMRIIQGDVAELGQFPWMARLGRQRSDKTKWFFCGGVLINTYYVITAAHCQERAHLVRLGENHLNTVIDCDINGHCAPPVQDIPIKKIKTYGFCPVTYVNDITLIELAYRAVFNDFIKPICLPTAPVSDEDLIGKSSWISGWGKTSPSVYGDPDNLMFITMPILDRLPCSRIYKLTKTLVPSQLCIGYGQGKDSCHGDAGGPVMVYMSAYGLNRSHLVGIVSYGLPDCGHAPAVYTNVGHFLDLLLNDIKKS